MTSRPALALSAGARRAIKGQDELLKRTRAAAIAASGDDADKDLARLQRVRPRTLLVIAALAGAFYFLLPQIAQVSSSWHALQSANWAWLPAVIALSALTYVASAAALIGSVPGPVPFGPAVLTQGASSFINRVSPANVGGMALNARFLQKSGTSTPASVAAVGVNSLAGAVMHLVLMVVFFALAGHDLTKAFKLPSGSKILLILAVIIAVIGVILATRPGRRWTRKQLIPGARSAAGSLRQAAASPVKLGLLVGGSALITLAYIAALAASVQAFGAGPGLAVLALPAAPGVRVSAGAPPSAQGAPARVPALPAGRRRRPSGAPPPLPRHVERSGYIWLAAAVVAVGAAIAMFAGGLSRWAVDVTVIDDAITRRVAGAPVPGFTAAARVIAEAGAALATVIAGFVLLLALIVLRRFRRLLVLVVSYEVLTFLTDAFLLVVHRPLPFGVPVQFPWGGFAMPSAEIERLCFVLTCALYTLVRPAGGGVAAAGPRPRSSP